MQPEGHCKLYHKQILNGFVLPLLFFISFIFLSSLQFIIILKTRDWTGLTKDLLPVTIITITTILLVKMWMFTSLIRMYYSVSLSFLSHSHFLTISLSHSPLTLTTLICTSLSFTFYFCRGIRTTHSEFGGRATSVFNAITSEFPTDLNGHGTHVLFLFPSFFLKALF